MKNYKQFLTEMPSKTIVFAFGRFSPPTTGHGLLVNVVKKIASSNKADYVIYASRTQDKKKNPLSVDKKIHYLNLMFPNTNFKPATNTERTFIEVAKALNSQYKNIIMIAGSDRVPDYETLLNKYNGIEFNYDSIQVISAGERDPDADDVSGMSASKMRALATNGNYQSFKKGLPSTMRDIDAKRLMNDVREGMGLDVIKEHLKFDINELRDKYYKKEIFNIGQIVEQNDQLFEILDRGTNYLVVIDSNGKTSRKWIQDVVMSEQTQLFTDAQFDPKEFDTNAKEVSFKGYTTKNFHIIDGVAIAFQHTINNMGTVDPIAVLNAIKSTDEYLGLSPEEILKGGSESAEDLTKWNDAHLKAKRALEHMGEFANHAEYWHLYKDKLDKAVYAVKIKKAGDGSSSMAESVMLDKNKDKLKVAKVIASILGVDDSDQSNNPENLVNTALRKSKSLNKDSLKIVSKMLKLADEVGINYDKKIMKSNSNLTTEQIELATERALRYGRRFPNPIDTNWALKEEAYPEALGSEYTNQTQKIVTCTDAPLMGLDPDDANQIKNVEKTGHKNGDTTPPGVNQSEISHVGSSLTPGKAGTDTIDRLKVKYMKEESCDCDDDEDLDNLKDEHLDKMIDSLKDDDYLDAYDDNEFSVVDSETGEEVKEEKPVNEEALMEVLSKLERMKARLRFAKNQPKIQRARMLALKRHSDSHKINKRARHLAVNLIRKKLLKGRDATSLSTTEKERIDRIIEKRKNVIGRMAMKLTTKVRANEKQRLTHKNFTQEK